LRTELQFLVVQQLHGFSDRQSFVSRAFTDCDVDGLASGCEQQHLGTGAAVRGAHEGANRGGLARTGGRG
jgi:hypothetical protein